MREMVKILIDPGHDIGTPGKRALDGSMREFEFNKAVALQVATLLAYYEQVELLFSHPLDDGVDQSLEHRTNLSNQWGADCFISIHANAGATSARGIETYIDDTTGDSVYQLARSIHDQLIVTTKHPNNRGIKRSNFWVLDKVNKLRTKSVLVECGFMTNVEDLKLLKSSNYRTKCAEGIVKGIVAHYDLKKKIVVAQPTATQYRVIAGSFSERVNAEAHIKSLKEKGIDSFLEIR